MDEVTAFLLQPDTVHDLSKKSGISVEVLMRLYAHDQDFGLTTKIVVVEKTAPELHTRYAVAYDVKDDGFVNPSQVRIANSKDSAIIKAQRYGFTPVKSQATEWIVIPVE